MYVSLCIAILAKVSSFVYCWILFMFAKQARSFKCSRELCRGINVTNIVIQHNSKLTLIVLSQFKNILKKEYMYHRLVTTLSITLKERQDKITQRNCL